MKNQRGITLIEMLAVLTLISVVSILIIGIIVNSQNTYALQQSTNQTTTTIAYSVNVISSDIRKYPNQLTVEDNRLIIDLGSGNEIIYQQHSSDASLLRNQEVLITQIQDFQVRLDNNTIWIIIIDSSGKEWSSSYTLRTGGDI